MTKRIVYLRLIVLGWMTILLFNGKIFAQQEDMGLWIKLEAEKKFTKKWSASVYGEVKLKENISRTGAFLVQVNTDYELLKFLDAGVSYRYNIGQSMEDDFEDSHKFGLGFTGKVKFWKFRVSDRLRFEMEVPSAVTSAGGMVPANHLRNNLKIGHPINKKLFAYLGCELFFETNDPKGNDMDAARYKAGVEYQITKHHALGFEYFIEQEYFTNDLSRSYIGQLAYTWSF